VILAVLAGVGAFAFSRPLREQQVRQRRQRAERDAIAQARARQAEQLARQRTMGPVVDLAVGTGVLQGRNHASGIPDGKHVYLDTDLLSRGVCVVGPPGSGKTRAVLQPLSGFWLECDFAGLFSFAWKPNLTSILARIARSAGRTPDRIHIVGPGHSPWPLLKNLSPDSVANFIRTAMELGGGPGRSDRFFVDSAVNLVRRTANVLYATAQYGPLNIEIKAENGEVVDSFALDYDLYSVSKLSRMDTAALAQYIVPQIRAAAAILGAQGNDDANRRIATNLPELLSAAGMKAEKTRDGIIASIDSVLAPFFTEYEFERAFSGGGNFDLSVLDRGDVVILDCDRDRYPNAAVLAFLLAFEQMKLYMRSRIGRQDAGETLNPVLFLADEYTNVADGKAHPEMWRTARESLVCACLSFQSQEDLRAAIGQSVADGLIHNFATVVAFATGDPATIALVQAGKSEVERTSTTYQKSEHEGSSSNPKDWSSSSQSGSSESRSSSTNLVERSVVDEQLMASLENHISRNVPADRQIADVVIRTIQNGRRVTDVCRVKAWDPPRMADEEYVSA
jgi:hypothetical protein